MNHADDLLLSARDIAASRGEKPLFYQLSLAIHRTGSLRIVGENGIGKTTLLKVLCGLLPVDEGDIHCPIPIHYIGHGDALPVELTVYEALRWYALILGGRQGAIEEALAFFKLAAYRDNSCLDLSMGQRRLCCLASLMITERPLWILDEPFAALGQVAIASLMKLFNRHLHQGGGLIYTDHQKSYNPRQELLLKDFCY